MSVYYSAYLAKEKNDGHYEVIGPYICDNKGEIKCKSFWWRSQSFIRWNEFEAAHIPVDLFDGDVTKKLMIEDFGEQRKYSLGYWLSAKEIYSRGSGEPIRGFLPVNEARALIESNYDQEYISWELESTPVSAEFIAGLSDSERNKYSFVSYIDYQSQAYHFWELSRILIQFESYELINDGEELGVLFQVG